MKSPGRRAVRAACEERHRDRAGKPVQYQALGGQFMRVDRLGFWNRAPLRFGPFSRLGKLARAPEAGTP